MERKDKSAIGPEPYGERIARIETKLNNGITQDIAEIKEDIKSITNKIEEIQKVLMSMQDEYERNKNLTERVVKMEKTVEVNERIFLLGILVSLLAGVILRVLVR